MVHVIVNFEKVDKGHGVYSHEAGMMFNIKYDRKHSCSACSTCSYVAIGLATSVKHLASFLRCCCKRDLIHID